MVDKGQVGISTTEENQEVETYKYEWKSEMSKEISKDKDKQLKHVLLLHIVQIKKYTLATNVEKSTRS